MAVVSLDALRKHTARERWVNDPYTRKFNEAIRQDHTQAVVELKSACMTSTDPKVRAAIERVNRTEVMLRFTGAELDESGEENE